MTTPRCRTLTEQPGGKSLPLQCPSLTLLSLIVMVGFVIVGCSSGGDEQSSDGDGELTQTATPTVTSSPSPTPTPAPTPTPSPVPALACVVDDEAFCSHARAVQSAAQRGDGQWFWDDAVKISCGEFDFLNCPPGEEYCVQVGLLASEGGCHVRDGFLNFIAPFLGSNTELYGIVYPTPPTFVGNIFTTDDGPLLLFRSPNPGSETDWILVVQLLGGAWHVSAAILAFPDLVNPSYIGAEIIPWE